MSESIPDKSQPPGGNPSLPRTNLAIYIFNMVEDEWSFIDTLSSKRKQLDYINDCEIVSDCYFLGSGKESDLLYISPKPISSEFQAYAKNLLRATNLEVVVPELITHLPCEDLLRDTTTLNRIIALCSQYKTVTLTSYAATPQLYTLKNVLIQAGIMVITPELPEPQNAWTVNFFGSKSGIRQLAQQSTAEEPDFQMPEGLICVGRADAAKIAADWYIKHKGVVLKTNKGSGGAGVLIFRENSLPMDYSACEHAILTKMNGDRYWDNFPIVIEDLVNSNLGAPATLPNVEYRIHRNGQISLSFVCATRVTPEGVYYGLDIGDDLLSDRLVARIVDTGYYIGEKYSKSGYRGVYDVDMMVGKNGQVYVNESNTRNTGGTDVFRLATKLLGPDFMDNYYIITRSLIERESKQHWQFGELLTRFQPILYHPRTKTGLIINSYNALSENKLSYTLIGKTKKQAYDLQARLLAILHEP